MKHRMRIRISEKRMGKRLLASVMAAVTASTAIAVPASAAPPRVQVDETMYVNLDYYGSETEINVVKGCSTNGVTEYTDYGIYEKVENMTDSTEPSVGNGSVTWKFPDKNQRFYYQCTLPKEEMELPWTFDISYKLNGVETEPKALNGASGLVEIHVKAVPNQKAKAYFRNNMILTVAVPADMSKYYSIDAPGSQLQSVGNYSAAVFMALPGEEGDYTVRLGSDSFESPGIVMMMVPGTASAFEHIADLKEAKDTWRENGDALYESYDAMLQAFESMGTGVSTVQSGLGQLEQGRQILSGSRAAIESGSAQALDDLLSVTEQTSKLIPYLETAQNAVTDINDNARAIYNTMEDMQDELDDLYSGLKSLQHSLERASDSIGAGITAAEQQAIAEEIQKKAEQLEQILAALGQLGQGAGGNWQLALEDWEDLEEALSEADSFRYDRGSAKKPDGQESSEKDSSEGAGKATASSAEEKETQEEKREKESENSSVTAFSTDEEPVLLDPDRRGPSGEPGSGGDNDADFEEWQEWQDEELEKYADQVEAGLQTVSGTSYGGDIGLLLQMVKELLGSSDETIVKAGALIQKINGLCSAISEAGEDTARVVKELRSCTDQLVNLLDDTRVMIDTMDSYVPSMLDALGATEELMNRLAKAMGSTESVLRAVHNTLAAAGDSLDGGAKNTLAGMQELLNHSLTAIESLKQVREASRNMKDTLDEQLDKFEEENNFLNLDPGEDLVSFTSGKNPSPHSIQILLRTEEIDDEALSGDTADLEASAQADPGPLARIWNVLVKIVKAVVDIFKNR